MSRTKSIQIPLPLLNSFEQIYAQIPAIDCKGLCHESCGMVPMTSFEWDRLVARHGKVPGVRMVDETDGKPWCPFLTQDKRCEHHAERPLLCRLWGTTEGMPCTFGCKPSRYLTDEEARSMMALADRIGGGPVPYQMEIILAGRKTQK